MVRRRLREVDFGWRGFGGITAVQCLIQVTNVVSWCAANHASLGAAGRGSCACLLRFLVWGLRGVFMDKVLMERGDWVHFEGYVELY